jgi:GntP family gluconate:H+ symporter
VVAPMMGTLDLSPEATMLAAAAGSIIIKYPNSSYFWVCTSLSRMSLAAAMTSFGGVTLINGLVAMAAVYAMWLAGII